MSFSVGGPWEEAGVPGKVPHRHMESMERHAVSGVKLFDNYIRSELECEHLSVSMC